MVKSSYIHIPFCKSKCHYCSFISFVCPEHIAKYILSLKTEIKNYYNNERLNTLYIGGGTPSVLQAKDLKFLELFNYDKDSEVTFEANPDDIEYEYLCMLKDFGINRLSLGVQSFDNEILKQINRRHNSKQVYSAVYNAQKAGFKNINLDFIYGLPKQTEKSFLNDLKTANTLGINHISLYGLTIEEGSYFYKYRPENIADDDMQANMYLNAIKILKDLQFEHYEISNFAKNKLYSKHNLNYWNNDEYYGFGVGAHGYEKDIRYKHETKIENYIKNPLTRITDRKETQKDKLEEEIFLGFRKATGINIEQINKKFSIDFERQYSAILKKYVKLNLIRKQEQNYSLTDKGFLVSNTILADFME